MRSFFKLGILAAGLVTAHGALATNIQETKSSPHLCFGSSAVASRRAVYLHGMDSIEPSAHEQENRKIMEQLARTLDMKIAVVRAPERCPRNQKQLCWPQATKAEVEKTWSFVREEAARCFGSQTDFGVIGFSNAGYFLGKMLNYCIEPRPSWSIALGSAGAVPEQAPKSLASCTGRFYLNIGRQDPTYKSAMLYANQLKSRDANLTLIEHSEGHIIPAPWLSETLKTLISDFGKKK